MQSFTFGLLILFSGVHIATAQIVQPMVYELEPIGSRSSIDLRIQNTKTSAITYELLALKISHDEYGNETSKPAEDDFIIYPPLTQISAGKTQVVKVKYVGDPTIYKSQTYRVVVAELPVDFDGSGSSGVAVAINFSTLCNVSPVDAKSDVYVSEISQNDNEEWLVTLENSGNRYSRLSETTVEVKNTKNPSMNKVYKNEKVFELFNRNLIAPNSKLIISVPALEGFEADSTEIKISQKS